MNLRRDYKKYPETYREREMRILAGWIRAGESGSVLGLAGAGKSNFMGFLCARPEVMRLKYLSNEARKLALVLVDLNNLPNDDLATLYRVILRSLYEARDQFAAIEESLPATVEKLYRKVEDKTDPFLSQSALREALFLYQKAEVHLVLVMDRFDQFCQTTPSHILDNLRGLRDAFKKNLSYIVGLRHELTYLRSPAEMAELYEILDTHRCWLGAMEEDDSRWVISQVEAGTGQSFSATEIQRLTALTGGHPALLRAASLWLAAQQSSPNNQDMNVWTEKLLAEKSIKNRLEEIWQGLTAEEEAALRTLVLILAKERQENPQEVEEKRLVLKGLQDKHICAQTNAGWQLSSPLFAKFITQLEGDSPGKIWRLRPGKDRFFRGKKELTGLTPKDCQLLHFFFGNLEEQPFTTDKIKDGAWPDVVDKEFVASEAVHQAIRQLRTKIELNPASPRYLKTEKGQRGYRFYPEGAPRD